MSNKINAAPIRVPVLLIIFNRPDTTRLVFESIRRARPPRLYVAADGPRAHNTDDIEKCIEARRIVREVDWDCEVSTLFHDVNLNCGVAPSTACSWFFKHESEGIILEDDCLPVQSFFSFCQELLERYRDDTRVMHIGGNNFLNGWKKDQDYSYYFSRSGHIWGWATWRRAWKFFDYELNLYQQVKRSNFFNSYFLNWPEKLYRMRKFEKTTDPGTLVDWWDYQWDFARYVHSGLAIVPEKNLVQNLGFGDSGTHTRNGKSPHADMKAEDIEVPLRHPPFMIRDLASDRTYFRNFLHDIVRAKFPGRLSTSLNISR